MEAKHTLSNYKDVYVKLAPDNDEIYYVLVELKNKKVKERVIGKKSDNLTPEKAYKRYQNKLYITKRHKTKYNGVFWRNSTTNGKKDKTYYIVFNDINGKSIEVKIGKESQNIGVNFAYQKYIESVNSIKHDEQPVIKRKRRHIFTFADAYEQYIKHAKVDKKSWNKDEQMYRLHLERFHILELVSLKKIDFNNLKAEKLELYDPRTVQYILAVARQIINYALNNDLIQNYTNPVGAGGVQIKKLDNANIGFFSHEQAKALLKELKRYWRSPTRIYQLTVLLLHTGARFSEVASLTWDEIDCKKKNIYFKATKEGNERWISMTALVEELIESLPRDNPLILPSSRGTQIKQMPDKFQDIVDSLIPDNVITVKRFKDGKRVKLSQEDRALLKKQTKKRLTTHSLRHTHASWMAISGNFNLMEIRDELGHKSIKMTERYAHLLPKERHRKTTELFDGIAQ